MSTSLPSSAETVPLTLWQRIVEKLSGGPPNQAKLDALKDKRWYDKYVYTMLAFTTCFTSITVPEAINYLDNHPFTTTPQTMKVRIVKTNKTIPHLQVELQDGSLRKMEWPFPISFQGRLRTYIWSDEERDRLPGCMATVLGVPARKPNDNRFQMWELDCPDQAIRLKTDESLRGPYAWIDSKLLLSLFHVAMAYLLVLVVFLRERRGNL